MEADALFIQSRQPGVFLRAGRTECDKGGTAFDGVAQGFVRRNIKVVGFQFQVLLKII